MHYICCIKINNKIKNQERMKKLLVLFLAITANVSLAQESVKLRLNYTKGDVYKVEMSQNISSPQMVMDMKMSSQLSITNVDGDTFNSESKFTRVVVDLMQGMNAMSYDSNKSDDELDEMGMMMKSQMSPMLKAVISVKGTNMGEVLESSSSVAFQGSENLGKSNVVFPKEAVKVGDTFTMDQSAQGITITTTYTVKEITDKTVKLDLASSGTAKITGTMTLDKATGANLTSEIVTAIEAQGVTTTMKVVTTKM